MSVALKDVDYEHCPFCHDSFKRIWGDNNWRYWMDDIYEIYDEIKGGKYCYRKEKRFCICATCHREVLFGDLPKK